jgi:DNA (cytosine-5)-methyltransferase 1
MIFTFADLFAGIGGFRLAAEQLGGKCLFTAENNKNALKVYSHNFGNVVSVDMTSYDFESTPRVDVCLAGFPCQSFSGAGFKKGFEDTRGTLFFNLLEYLQSVAPQIILLENVRGLIKHNSGKTITVIRSCLEELGYYVDIRVLRASDYGLPQHRPRAYIIGYKNSRSPFFWPPAAGLLMKMSNVLEGPCSKDIGFTLRQGGYNSPINDRHNWNGYLVNGLEHRLAFNEAKLMQGFPIDFSLPADISEKTGVQLLGNAVCVPVVKSILTQLLIQNKIT